MSDDKMRVEDCEGTEALLDLAYKLQAEVARLREALHKRNPPETLQESVLKDNARLQANGNAVQSQLIAEEIKCQNLQAELDDDKAYWSKRVSKKNEECCQLEAKLRDTQAVVDAAKELIGKGGIIGRDDNRDYIVCELDFEALINAVQGGV